MRRMSIPELAQKLDQAESMYGQVHPQVLSILLLLYCTRLYYINTVMGASPDCINNGKRLWLYTNVAEVTLP